MIVVRKVYLGPHFVTVLLFFPFSNDFINHFRSLQFMFTLHTVLACKEDCIDDAINGYCYMTNGSPTQYSSIIVSCSDVMCSKEDNEIDDRGSIQEASHNNIPLHLHQQIIILNPDQNVCHDFTRHIAAAPETIPSSNINDSSTACAKHQDMLSSKQRQLRRKKSRSCHSSSFYYKALSASSSLLLLMFGLAILLLLLASKSAASSTTGSIHKKTNLNTDDDDITNNPTDDYNLPVVSNIEVIMPSTDTTTTIDDAMTFVATTTTSAQPKRATTEEIKEASSICKLLAQNNNNNNNSINTHLRMKPLLSSACHRYVSCNDDDDEGSVLLFHTCPDDLLFDVTIQICNWPDRVECPEYNHDEDENGVDKKDGEQNNIVQVIEQDNISINNNDGTNNNNGVDAEGELLDVNDLFEHHDINPYNDNILETVCIDKPTKLYPLPTTGCREYVSCVNGQVALTQECPDRLIFDSNIQGCNWADLVECRDDDETLLLPPTLVPTSGGNDDDETPMMPTETQPSSSSTTTTTGQQQPPTVSNNLDKKVNIDKILETVCVGKPTRVYPLPTTGCREYVSCVNGQVALTQECPDRLIFDSNIQGCNWADRVECRDETLPPTLVPTGFPTRSKDDETPVPTETQPSTTTTGQQPPTVSNLDEKANIKIYEWLDIRKQRLNDEVFQSVTKEGVRYRSYWFQYNDFIKALKVVSNGDDDNGSITGDPKHSFYLGNKGDEWEYGVTNIAVFLAHAVTLSIQHDACDEFHTDMNTDVAVATGEDNDEFYAISNSCGQYGLNYGDFHCGEEERHMECEVDPNLNLQATTSLIYPSAPPPLTCRPRSVSESYTGYWDVRTGKEMTMFPYENSHGRTDVEGCCYWGRGAIHTRGVCNLGKLNWFLGKKVSVRLM